MVFIFSLERMSEKLKNRLVINVNEIDRHILGIDFSFFDCIMKGHV